MQAIQTRYFGPTNKLGSRIKAVAQGGSIILSYEPGKNGASNHLAAAEALAKKLGWQGIYVGGTLPNGDQVFVPIGGGEGFFGEIPENRRDHINAIAYAAKNPVVSPQDTEKSILEIIKTLFRGF